MLFRNLQAFAFVLIAVGGAVLAYYGEQWYRLPQPSASQIEEKVEATLAIEVERMGPHLRPDGERLDRLRGMVRAEVEGKARHERRQLERWMGAGLLLLAFGVGQWLMAALQRK